MQPACLFAREEFIDRGEMKLSISRETVKVLWERGTFNMV